MSGTNFSGFARVVCGLYRACTASMTKSAPTNKSLHLEHGWSKTTPYTYILFFKYALLLYLFYMWGTRIYYKGSVADALSTP